MASDPTLIPLDNDHLETVVHHNREYQRYAVNNNIYFAPVDEDETERLEIMHGVFNLVFDNRLIFPPITRPRRILECGYGTASWAIAVAQAYPNCQVVGIDISPHMLPPEEALPENLDLQVDDLNRRFAFPPNHFDLVHSQMMAGGIDANRWRDYLRDIFRVTRPGGWCQMVELYLNAQSDNGTLEHQHALSRWSRCYLDAAAQHKDPRAANHMERRMRHVGFVEIETTTITLPMCAWPSDPRQYNIGLANTENTRRMLSSLATYPFTEQLGMSIADVQLLVAQARAEAENPALKPYFPLTVCIGRKPRR